MKSVGEELTVSRLDDIVRLAQKKKSAVRSSFIAATDLCAFSQFKLPFGISKIMWGGYDGAERLCFIAYPDFLTFDSEEVINSTCGISVLTVTNTSGDKLSHRDYLGSLMSLGIERKTVGDILISDNKALIFILDPISDYVAQNMEKVAGSRVNITRSVSVNAEIISNFLPKTERREIIVSSLRLDTVISEVYSLSRNVSSQLVEREAVRINHTPCCAREKNLCDGDLVSVNSKGRFKVGQTIGITKKGNLILEIFVYV